MKLYTNKQPFNFSGVVGEVDPVIDPAGTIYMEISNDDAGITLEREDNDRVLERATLHPDVVGYAFEVVEN